jgi:hypothetical protein
MNPTHMGNSAKPGRRCRFHLTDDAGRSACGRQCTDLDLISELVVDYDDRLCARCLARLAADAARELQSLTVESADAALEPEDAMREACSSVALALARSATVDGLSPADRDFLLRTQRRFARIGGVALTGGDDS